MHYTTPRTALDRLRTELRRRADALGTTTFQASHRDLAAAIGCSASYIKRMIQTLIADGTIAREPYKNTFLIMVIDHPIHGDRSLVDRVIDHHAPDRREPQPDTPNSSSTVHQVKTSCMVDHDSCKQHEQHDPRARSNICEQATPQPPPGFFPGAWHMLLTTGYDQAQAEADIATLTRRGYERPAAIGIIVQARRHGELIYAKQEQRDGSGACDPGYYRANRDDTPAGGGYRGSGGSRCRDDANARAGAGTASRGPQRPRRMAESDLPLGGWGVDSLHIPHPGAPRDLGW